MKAGTILKGIGGFYYVAVGNEVFRCKARGRFRNLGITPMVGDHVQIEPGIGSSEGSVEEIKPRKNVLIRPAVANIDYLAVVIAAASPNPDLLLVDKLLIAAEMNNIKPLLIFNKIDLVSKEKLNILIDEYRPTGYSIFCVSGKIGLGMDELSRGLDGITTLAGQSGVGKSSIINKLNPSLNLETGIISEKLKRGKHTTRHIELLILPYGGMIVDTPGFSQMEVLELDTAALSYNYPEFQPFVSQCRFNGCTHSHEPQCAIRKSVEDGSIPKGRYDRYIKLLNDIAENRRNIW